MPDELTQKDIDSLLKGNVPIEPTTTYAADVIPYNFLRPPRISRDRQATLDAIYSRFALGVQAMLSSRLRTPTDVSVSSVEQATFAEFIFSLANPCAAFVFDLGTEGNAQGVLDIGTDLSLFLVDRLFGGPGDNADLRRPMTQLEMMVIQGIVSRTLSALAESWQDYIPMKPQRVGFEANPDALQVSSREDNVLVSNLEVRSGPFSALLTVCLPLHALEAFLQEAPARGIRSQIADTADRDRWKAHVGINLQASVVDVAVRFPQFLLTTGQIAALAEGSIVHTGHPLESPVELHVSGSRRFLGKLGHVRQFLGLHVMKPVRNTFVNTAKKAPRGRLL